MYRLPFLFAFLAVFLSAATISGQAGRVLNDPITSRYVLMSAIVEKVLGQSSSRTATELRELDLAQPRSREFVRQTTATLIEWAVDLEARAFSAAPVTAEQLSQAERQLNRQLNQNSQIKKRWQSLGPQPSEVKQLLERKLRAQKFIEFKIESSTLPISDKEALDYFESNRLQFEDLPFERFKAKIKELLSRQQVDRRLKDWFELLQAKYKIKNWLQEQ
jgi:hypothetical protein